jgi:hypothetical protein
MEYRVSRIDLALYSTWPCEWFVYKQKAGASSKLNGAQKISRFTVVREEMIMKGR